jgi:hypothetical protein
MKKKKSHIINELNTKGYFVIKGAFKKTARNIFNDATFSRINLNNNKISGVYSDNQYFFTNLLCVSSSFYDFVTSNFVLQVCKKYLGNKFRLKAMRYYETFSNHYMQWHTDNKTDEGFAKNRGIIFILYVSDVYEGEFQYIEGSHLWSVNERCNDYSDQYIANNFASKIKSFKLPMGSLIIYNTYGIHRAKTYSNNKFVRKSVFFQVDNKINNSEPVIINTKFLKNINNDISMLFGFGKKQDYKIFPNTSINSLPLTKEIFYNFIKYFTFRFFSLLINLARKIKRIVYKIS